MAELARELGDKTWCNGEGYSLADIAAAARSAISTSATAEIDWRTDYHEPRASSRESSTSGPRSPDTASARPSTKSGTPRVPGSLRRLRFS